MRNMLQEIAKDNILRASAIESRGSPPPWHDGLSTLASRSSIESWITQIEVGGYSGYTGKRKRAASLPSDSRCSEFTKSSSAVRPASRRRIVCGGVDDMCADRTQVPFIVLETFEVIDVCRLSQHLLEPFPPTNPPHQACQAREASGYRKMPAGYRAGWSNIG